jgi:nucleoside-diphosphate-sugar epimerase
MHVVAADVASPEAMPRLPEDLDSVVYMVGASASTDAAYYEAYVRGVEHVLRAVERDCPRLRRVVFVSSTGVYAQDNGEWIDEDSPAEAAHFTGRRLLEGEALVRSSGVPAVVVRLGGIYGPGRTRLINGVREGTALCPPEPKYINLIHRDDCAGAIRHVMQLANPQDLYLGVDHEPADRGEILRWVASQLELPEPPVGAMPGRGGHKRCSSRRLVASGYDFLYPTFREGYARLLGTAG